MVYVQKLCSIGLILALVLVFCACQSPELNPPFTGPTTHQDPSTIATSVSTGSDAQLLIPPIPPQDEITADVPDNNSNWVFTNYQQTLSWRDQAGNYCAMTLCLPALAPAAEFALEFNRQMLQLGQSLLQEARECHLLGYSPSTNYLNYDTVSWNHLTFLVVNQHFADGYTQKQVFTFDFAKQKLLPLGQVTEALTGMDYPTFLQAAGQTVSNHFTEQYSNTIVDLERQAEPSGDYGRSEPDPRIAVYYRTLEQLPYSAFHMAQYALIPDQSGNLLLSCPMPTLDEGISVPAVIPFAPEELDWQATTDAAAYGRLFDLQHYITKDHAEAYRGILLEAYFSNPVAFTEFAAKEDADSTAILIGSIALAANAGQKSRLIAICQELTFAGESAAAEALFTDSLLAALQ